MEGPLTVRLDDELRESLESYCRDSGRSRSEVVREALRRQLQLLRFERVRERLLPFAEARGYLTDEDVFGEIS